MPYDPRKFGGMHYLRYWKRNNSNQEYNWTLQQEEERSSRKRGEKARITEEEKERLANVKSSSSENAEEK